MKNKLHVVVAIVGLVGLSALAWWWQHRPPAGTGELPAADVAAAPLSRGAASAGPVPVEVARAEARDLVDDTLAVGSLRSRQGVVLRPEVAGRIVKLGFADGQRVKRGQLLVQLDDALQRAQLRQAEAQLAIARTTLKRNEELVAQNFVTRSVLDQAQATVTVAEAQVALNRAQLERMRLVAPFDAQAGIRLVDVGDYLKDGADIVALEDISSVYVDFSLPERFATRLKPDQKVAVAIDSLPGRSFTAVVEALEPQITADGRAIAARARIPNGDAQLRPGMFARVRVVLAQRPGAVLVPEEAVVPQADKELLIKVIEGDQGPTSQRIEVRTGLRRDGKVEILGGLQAGEQVVTAGQARLLRGDAQPLRVVQLGQSGAKPASDALPVAPSAASAARAG